MIAINTVDRLVQRAFTIDDTILELIRAAQLATSGLDPALKLRGVLCLAPAQPFDQRFLGFSREKNRDGLWHQACESWPHPARRCAA